MRDWRKEFDLPPIPGEVVIRLKGFQPRGKASVRWSGSDHRFHGDSKSETFMRRLRQAAAAAMVGRIPFEGGVAVEVKAVFTVPKSWSKAKKRAALAGEVRHTGKPDWDNLGKMCDSFKGLAWSDDAQVCDGRIIKLYGTDPL